MPFSGREVSEKGFPQGWDADADSSTAQRILRVTQLLEAMVFRPFSWDRFNSLGLRYNFHGGYIDNGVDEWLLIADGSIILANDALNFIERSDAGQVSVNQSGFTYLGFIPMAQIQTSGGSFIPTSYVDRRPEIGGAPAGGGGGLITFPQIIGLILDAQVPLSAVAQWQFFLDLSFTQMIDQIADAQVPESAVTQHEAALSLLFTQLTDEIADDQVPASAVLQYCAEIADCIGASLGGGFSGGLTELLNFLLARSTGLIADDRISPSSVTQFCDEILKCSPFDFLLKRATSRRPWSSTDRLAANGALV